MIKVLSSSQFIDAYRKFFPYVRPYLFMAVTGVLLTVPVGLMDAVISYFLKPFMDNVLVDKEPEFTSLIPFIIVGFTLVQGIFIYLSALVNGYVGNKITLDIRRDLYRKLIHMDSSYYTQNNTGNIIYRYYNDAELASNGLINNLKLFLTKFFSSVSLIGVLLYNSWQLSVIAVGVLVILVLPLRVVRKKIQSIMTKTYTESAELINLYNEITSGQNVVKSYNLQGHMQRLFEEKAGQLFRLAMRLIRNTNWLSPVMHLVAACGVAIVIAFGGSLILNGTITSGEFVSFLAALIMLYTPLKSIGNNFVEVQKAIVALDRIYEIYAMDNVEEREAKENKPKLEKIEEGIEFRNVSFSYDATRKVLDGISLKVAKSQTVAFVGNSGGGKSTVCSLIPRINEWQEGDILIDGKSARDYDINSLRDCVSYVFQDNFLFNDTIRNNIVLGKRDATEEEINEALRDACLADFVKTLPEGLDTPIGERGTLLSGGQRQRVAIARAFVKNAPIVILDEATSALDNKSEKVVQEALENLMKDRTVFVIAHRLSTIRDADTIVVINDGHIVEQGPHEELLKLGGFYSALYSASSGTEERAEGAAETEAPAAEPAAGA